MRRRKYYKRLNTRELNNIFVRKRPLQRCIDGRSHEGELRVGYYWNHSHPGQLTMSLLKEHNCIGKKCKLLYTYYEIENTANGLVLGEKKAPKEKKVVNE